MELRHLRYFVAVAEQLSFTHAAEKLHLAQPSLTRQIHNLEDELGVRLLNRSKSHISLTQEGKSFLADAKRLLAMAADSVAAVRRLSRGDDGELNIAYLSHFNFELLPQILEAYHQAFPNIVVNLFDLNPAEQLRALEGGKVDLAFVGLRPPVASKPLVWQRIARHPVVVALPAKHVLNKKGRVKFAELKGLSFVGLAELSHPGSRAWLCKICEQGGGFTPRILQEAELEPSLLAFVADGLGVTLVREQIRRLPHPGVTFRPLAPAVHSDYFITWLAQNDSKALKQYLRIVQNNAVLA